MLGGDLLQVDQLSAGQMADHLGLGLAVVAEEGLGVHSNNRSITLLDCNSNALVADGRRLLFNPGVDNKTIRRLNLEYLIGERETIANLAKLYDLNESLLSQVKNGTRNMGDRLARKMEEAMAKPTGWMDVPHFKSQEQAVEYAELMHIYDALPEGEREAWLKLGRSLVERGPKGPNNPFGAVPKPKGDKKGTQ